MYKKYTGKNMPMYEGHLNIPEIDVNKSILKNYIDLKRIYAKFIELNQQTGLHIKSKSHNFMKNQYVHQQKLNPMQRAKSIRDHCEAAKAQKEIERRIKKYQKMKIFKYAGQTQKDISYLELYKQHIANQSPQSLKNKFSYNQEQVSIEKVSLPKGIKNYELLKKRPKLVNYILKRIQDQKQKQQYQWSNSQRSNRKIIDIVIKMHRQNQSKLIKSDRKNNKLIKITHRLNKSQNAQQLIKNDLSLINFPSQNLQKQNQQQKVHQTIPQTNQPNLKPLRIFKLSKNKQKKKHHHHRSVTTQI